MTSTEIFNSLSERQIYMLYDVYADNIQLIERKEGNNEADRQRIEDIQATMQAIEQYASEKRNGRAPLSKEQLLLQWGAKPTLLIQFYPGSYSYRLYGRALVVMVEYSEADFLQILSNIENKVPEQNGEITVSLTESKVKAILATEDFFEVESLRR